ncbi:hypothetical protein B0O99DRAFT_302686 [Bisporella sp. PMI_857]|nr:hypothetical protein B0O99DRAFT_302686 [Bisporella sp. PMI_857]
MDRHASDREISNRESSRPLGQRGRSRARSRSPNLPGYQDDAGDQAPGRSFVQPSAQPPPARQPPAQQQAIPYLQPSPSGQGVQSVVPSYMGVIPLKKPNFNVVVNGERIAVERASTQELLAAINDYVDRHGYHPNRYEYFDRRPRRRTTLQDIESNLVDDRRRRAYVDNQRRLAADRAAEAVRRAIDEGPPLLGDQSQEPDFNGYGGQHRQFPQCGTTQDNVADDGPFVNNNEWQAATRRSPSPVREDLYGDGDYIVNPGDNAWGNGDDDDPYGIYGADDDDDSSSSNHQRLPSPDLPVLLRPPVAERLLGRLGSPYDEYHRARNRHDGLPDEEWARFYWSLPEVAQAEIFQDDVLIEIIFDGKTVTDYISGIVAKILEHPPSVPLEVFKNIPISPDWRDFLTILAQSGEIKPWYWADIMHHIMSGMSPLQWKTRLERFRLGVFDDGSIEYLGSTTSPLSSPPSSPPEELTQFVESELAIVRERELAAHLRNLARVAREMPSQIFSPDVHGTIDQWINLPEKFRRLGIASSTSRSLLIRLLKPYGYDLDVHGNMFEWVAAGMPDGRGQRQQNPDYDPAVVSALILKTT